MLQPKCTLMQIFIIKKKNDAAKREGTSYLANPDTCRKCVGFPAEGRDLSSGTLHPWEQNGGTLKLDSA